MNPLAILDTNVIIGACRTSDSASYKIVERFKHGHFDIVMNTKLLEEYEEKLNDLLRQEELHDGLYISNLMQEIRRRMIFVRTPIGSQHPTRDPDDRHIFDIVAMRRVDYIVSHDREGIVKFSGTDYLNGSPVVSASEFLEILNNS